jgi:hypothetical protein
MKEKLISLVKYAEEVKSKLSDIEVPLKHKNRPQAYREFLSRELVKVNRTIEELKLKVNDSKK